MIKTGNYAASANYYKNTNAASKTISANIRSQETGKIKTSENKLSDKAKNYLESLRKSRADYDFIIADKGDDFKKAVKNSTKEFSVILSSDELEKMASDEKYAEEKLSTIDNAVAMSRKINEQYYGGSEEGGLETDIPLINKLTITFNEDGSMTLFADLQKFSEKMKEKLENADEKAEEGVNEKRKFSVQRATIQASSEEELYKKISEFDWSKVPEEKDVTGAKFNMSV